MPRMEPSISASTIESAAAARVRHRPGKMYPVQVLHVTNGFHFSAVNWSLPANTAITYAKIATRIAMKTTATIALRTRARGPGAS